MVLAFPFYKRAAFLSCCEIVVIYGWRFAIGALVCSVRGLLFLPDAGRKGLSALTCAALPLAIL